MKTALATGLSLLAISAAPSAQTGVQPTETLQRVSIQVENAEEIAARLDHDGFDTMHGPVSATEIHLVVNNDELIQLMRYGFDPTVLEIGRPFNEIQAERAAQANGGNSKLPPPAGYPDLAGIRAQMQALAASNPSICEYVDLTARYGIPSTFGGRHMTVLKISDNVGFDEDEPAALIVSNHHAREITTPLIALRAAEELVNQYGIDPAITQLVDGNEIWIAPTWNPDGYNEVFVGNNLWRKNRRQFANGIGVDLNRNYDFRWNTGCSGSTNVGSETYKGPSPASEAETVTMEVWSEDVRFAKVIDYHSFGRETLWGNASCSPTALDAYYQSEAILLSQNSGYGSSNRRPSADGEEYAWNNARYGNSAFLMETHNQFQPSFASGLAEAEQLLPGILYFLDRNIPLVGHVTDAVTGFPVEATVSYRNVNFTYGEENTSDPKTGRYHVFLPNGNRILTFSAPGYRDTCIAANLNVASPQTIDVTMMPLGACPQAAVTSRNGGGNPNVYAATPIIIGQPTTFTVDTLGWQFATIFAVDCPQQRFADVGFVLIDIDNTLFFQLPNIPGPIAQVTTTVTNDPALCGRTIYTQAKLHNTARRPFVLTNAQDFVIGTN